MTKREPLLRVDQLATGYGDLRVVWDVSFDVRPGELAVLLGRNGAGKTSTMRAVTGLNRTHAGSVTFQGENITRLSTAARTRRGIAFVQEGKRVFHNQTVEQNLVLGGYTVRAGLKKLRVEAEKIYELFPILGEKRAMPAGSMSGGQQQMLAIGQALMAEPSLLLLDEPSAGLAPVIMKEVMEQVRLLKETGIGIVLVEQAVEASVAVADHVTVLDMGRVVLSEKAADVDIEGLQAAYFGRAGAAGAA